MKTLTRGSVLAAAVILTVSAAALADEGENHCSVKTLRGTYIFAAKRLTAGSSG
jgi:hypothetical protein